MATSKKIVIALLGLFIWCSGLCLAEPFGVTIVTLNNKILANETAFFRLTIQNNEPKVEQYSIYTQDVEWTFVTQPSRDYVLKVYPNSEGETLVAINPYVLTKPGLYGVTVSVKALSTEQIITKQLLVEIQPKQPSTGSYLPSLHLDSSLAEKVDPRQPVKIRIDLVNQNPLSVSNVTLRLSSRLIHDSFVTQLAPLEAKSVDFTISLDPYQDPLQDTLRVTASAKILEERYDFEALPQSFEVIGYSKLVQSETSDRNWLKRTTVITLYNDGNTKKEYSVRIKRTLAGMILTSYSPNPRTVKVDDATYYSWPVILAGRESSHITMTLNLWGPALLIAAGLAAILLYYLLRSPLLVIKSSQVLATKNGGISELAVQLDIKNRGKRTLKNVHIIDKLPNLLDFHKETRAGVVAPDNVLKHDRKGTILKWGLGSLEPFEERVITFKALSRLSILGGLNLPAAYGNFEKKSGKEQSTTSNALYVQA